MRILAYGDSNTWGWKPVPDGQPVPRYTDEERWAGVMQGSLGSSFTVEVNGLIGRTLDADLPQGVGLLEGRDHNGMRRLPLSLAEADPVNLVVVMLGINDFIEDLNREPADVAKSLTKFVEIVNKGTFPLATKPAAPRILVVIPPPLADTRRTPVRDLFGSRAMAKSKLLAAGYNRVAAEQRFAVFDAGEVVQLDGIDGLHMSAAMHKRLGQAVARKVRELLSDSPSASGEAAHHDSPHL